MKIIKNFLIAVESFILLLPVSIFAQQTGGGGPRPDTSLPDPLGGQSFAELINRFISWLIKISAPLFVIFLIIGAFQIMTAGGDENKFKKGKNTLTYTIIGFGIILLAKGIIFVVKEFLGV